MKRHFLVAMMVFLPVMTPTLVHTAFAATTASHLGDLSGLKTIAGDTLTLVSKKDLPAAKIRITDFETNWDKLQPTLYPMDKAEWGVIDDAADLAIKALRKRSPDKDEAQQAVTGLINALNDPKQH